MVADADLCREVGIKKFKSITNRSMPTPIRSSPIHHKGLFFTRLLIKWTSLNYVDLDLI